MNSQVEEIVELLKKGKKTHKYKQVKKEDKSNVKRVTPVKKKDKSKVKRVTPVADSLERAKAKVKKSIKRKRVDYLSK